MTARLFLLLACATLVHFSSLRAEIHVDDPVMVAALEDYAKFAADRPGACVPRETPSSLAVAISKFFGFKKEAPPSGPEKVGK